MTHVLVVDTYRREAVALAESIRIMAKGLKIPCEVIVETDSTQAIARVMGDDQIKLVVTCYMMSGSSGLDLAEKLKRQGVETKVLANYPPLSKFAEEQTINPKRFIALLPQWLREIGSDPLPA